MASICMTMNITIPSPNDKIHAIPIDFGNHLRILLIVRAMRNVTDVTDDSIVKAWRVNIENCSLDAS
jgi:hypothetical protein